ncbi:1-acyl-sn-glycerol-3-phosphate acyltransferase [Roseibacterium sp. SDUM158017]|uniref:1-acyl-sn-glycerol-3-phosphate acyltransferase n=1 Tax=Roseicyclus salinarum TaxID=3036773 RepID=UPI00241530A6|nr:1-acyl-sn-glycerol-3-phosphate acyltransferase [Roseibacterium sp. SDUM158017]MDG4648085.1 1-acyl-sn-glycerol-3-phosphate acyltransferase [Roseibacterium sp. SDUM158017]
MNVPMDMQSRIDPLIAERAPWLATQHPAAALARAILDRLLGQRRTVALAEALAPRPAEAVMDTAARLIARRITASGLQNVPSSGPALIVSNHPTGIADGLVLWRVLARRRTDAFFFANSDVLRVLPQLDRVIAPVEWRRDRRSHAKARETLAYARHALVEEGRLGVIFPSGRLAKRRGLRLHERPWMTSAATLARKLSVPVVPVHVRARNSSLFYAFDAIHPTLRDITLFHETLNKAHTPYRVTIGEAIDPATLPQDPVEATEALRRATLSLGETADGPGMPLLPLDVLRPSDARASAPRA